MSVPPGSKPVMDEEHWVPGDPRLAPIADLRHAQAMLARWQPPTSAQARTRERMLEFLAEHPDALHRSCLAGHLTASALVIDAARERALFTHHAKLGRWLQLGGHCDGDANLPAVALRECIEESGIPDLAIAPLPIDLDVHPIPARPDEPEHLHLDTRFLVYAPPHARAQVTSESLDLAWLTGAELARRNTDESVLRLVRHALPS